MSFQNIGRTHARSAPSSGRSFRYSENYSGANEVAKQKYPLQEKNPLESDRCRLNYENRNPLNVKTEYQNRSKSSLNSTPCTPSNPLAFRNTDKNAYLGQNSHTVKSNALLHQTKSEVFFAMSEEVSIYQREVGQLVKTVHDLGNSSVLHAANEWKCRQRIDQVEKRGNEIDRNLRSQEVNIQNLPRSEAARARSSHVRLTRDFRYVQSAFRALKLEFKQGKEKKDQNTHAIDLNSNKKNSSDLNPLQLANLNEEEYAFNVMNEREAAISEINQKMHHVNEIYKDLGHIVVTQQEHIDLVENTVEQSCNNAKMGLDTLEKANHTGKKSFGNIFQRQQEIQEQQDQHQQQFHSLHKNVNENQKGSNNCGIGLALDMTEVRKDLRGISSDFMSMGKNTLRALQMQVMRCAITR